MRSPDDNKAISRRDGWTIDVRATLLHALAFTVVVALLAVFIGRASTKWLLVDGAVQDQRIVADHAIETKGGGQLTWKAEYRVAYFVGGRNYSLWADSGIRGESENVVRLALPQSRPLCQVRYEAKRPEVSVAVCR
jgi:hypothetical protein